MRRQTEQAQLSKEFDHLYADALDRDRRSTLMVPSPAAEPWIGLSGRHKARRRTM
ncbi:hypothetical protein [Mesorhizobium sp. M8A.F.Ca.ET.057.01.1.1]|uniref:hypothetical protein n=1 Tax=Mesorhizobium sp. M8A.F.Ca.ET.057.01.1.1 TaxID=2493679 RepID=UPI001ABF8643|nr:hypothetical protein [Mesorhizobium sp. M8A.F.Ca.ET.057.01.1.1]